MTHKECKKYTNLDGLVCVFKYEGIIRQVIHQLKYKFAYDIAEELAENMVKSARFEPIFLRIDCLIPIPVTDKRRRWRGFNQTEELGKVVSEKLGVKYLPVLVKKKDTLPQVELDTKERNQNLKGVFSIESGWEEKLKGRRMLIFDDVFTTGSTLFEAAKTLSRAYAEAMFGFTFAG